MSDSISWSDDATHLGVGRLLAAYADAVTRYAWDELEDLFLAGAPVVIDTGRGEPVRLAGATEVGEFIAGALERFEFFEMVPLNHVVLRDGAGMHGRCYIHEIRQERNGGPRSDAYGLYEDRYELVRSGRWRFAERRYRSLARGGDRLEVVSFAGEGDSGHE
jgi:SnoaL-like domain